MNLLKLKHIQTLLTNTRTSIALLFLQIAVVGIVCSSYVLINALFVLGIVAFVYISLTATSNKKQTPRFFFCAVLCLILALFFRSNSFLYLGAVASIYFTIEAYFKRLPTLGFLLLLLISPISYYFFETYGFEIKLQITHTVVSLLQQFNTSIRADGNLIIINHTQFSIDTACMGLRMTGYALCMTLFLHYYYLHNSQHPFIIDLLILIFAIILNVFANFSRILLLVIFQIVPSNPSHYIVGLVCFIFYSILPLLFVFPRIRKSYSNMQTVSPPQLHAISALKHFSQTNIQRDEQTQSAFSTLHPLKLRILQLVLVLLLLVSWNTIRKNNIQTIRLMQLPHGFTQKTLKSGTIQLQSSNTLVYIKPIRSFLSSEHTPALCWIGSGYEISYINRCSTQNQQIFYGILDKQSHKLYTAWWIVYQNHKTIQQFEWRKAILFQNATCCLVNVTATTPSELQNSINAFWDVKF